MKKDSRLFLRIGMILLGLLFIVKRSGVIHSALTLIAAILVFSAVFDFIKKQTSSGIVKGVIALAVMIFGWMFVELAFSLIAVLLLFYGIVQLVQTVKQKPKGYLPYAVPIFSLVAGCCLLFNQGGTVDWIFVVVGIVLIAEGILSLIRS